MAHQELLDLGCVFHVGRKKVERVEDEVRSVNLDVVEQAFKLWPIRFSAFNFCARVREHVTDFGLVESPW